MSQPAIVNGMSVDVEDWFQVGAFEGTIKRSDWDSLELRVGDNVARILDLFDDAGVKATFFTLGWIAERNRPTMRAIVERGHELASHGYDHARVFTLTPEQFSEDVSKTRAILEDAGGKEVTGYRAPSFSIDGRNSWAHAILAEHGYSYSSSVAPIVHDHYGWREAPRFAFNPVMGSDLVEIPVTTAMLGNRRLAAGGGGFFRVLPYAFSRWAISQVNRDEERPAIFYFHPWEVDPEQPRVAKAPVKSRIRHYTNLSNMHGKIARLLGDFSWGRMDTLAGLERAKATNWPS
ncbi:MAG: polysaccharide deacetylase family protein [Citromicrobium sp.]|nr:MAG: polysaccharide deacetylase family protein [Citromicrobium sp.]